MFVVAIELKSRLDGRLSPDTRLPLPHVSSFAELQDLAHVFALH